jgi:hypothetical protein
MRYQLNNLDWMLLGFLAGVAFLSIASYIAGWYTP